MSVSEHFSSCTTDNYHQLVQSSERQSNVPADRFFKEKCAKERGFQHHELSGAGGTVQGIWPRHGGLNASLPPLNEGIEGSVAQHTPRASNQPRPVHSHAHPSDTSGMITTCNHRFTFALPLAGDVDPFLRAVKSTATAATASPGRTGPGRARSKRKKTQFTTYQSSF
mmetsp:Transcript_74311/g.159285  ORF Transcript_74311/g.159285 Transcript_74311/m.159285 type:complete len:168 (+) Transcript_74311:76-579(+)